MGSQSHSKLPAIDFTKPELKPGTHQWDSVKGQVQQALQELGCFEALFDKIPLETRETIFGAMEELFDLPLEIKTRNISKLPYYGYIGQHPKLPLFESIGFDDAHIIQNVEAQTRTFWPQGNTSFRSQIQSFAKELRELSHMIRRMILEIFQVEKYMDEHMKSSEYLLKVMKYKGPKTSEARAGLGAHTDVDLVTILYQNEVNGLGLQSTSTGEWIDWIPSKDAFVITIGESLHAWLNGRLKATYHRVMLSGDKPRYSVGLFTVPKAGYLIKAPEELVDEAHPLLYKPFDYAELLRFLVSNEGRCPQSLLKAYCGV
ncbi:probable 2-oxoglutarate-dependent dioxygenase AOP1.2 [Hibiscus syriacus]|uniref:probable 2-oxoglutarate-dependent dioxygenase AOP1.2 n=1 Tax=Hibiscus syriacus TaxID=106335 RepID=UPI0019227316|nr:probable 2-oxoglutarate-dependent dioxygenase AOP1.2 [Hibiscus syriacus]